MDITAAANRTLAIRDNAHAAQDALTAIMSEIIAADGKPSAEAVSAFEAAAANLISVARA